jgi:hypothetical protein
LKASFPRQASEIEVEPVMEALVRLREVPEILGVSMEREPAALCR